MNAPRVKYWEIIADNLSKAGWNWGCVSAIDRQGRTIWIADALREGKRLLVHANEKLTTFWNLNLQALVALVAALREGDTFQNSASLSGSESGGRHFPR